MTRPEKPNPGDSIRRPGWKRDYKVIALDLEGRPIVEWDGSVVTRVTAQDYYIVDKTQVWFNLYWNSDSKQVEIGNPYLTGHAARVAVVEREEMLLISTSSLTKSQYEDLSLYLKKV